MSLPVIDGAQSVLGFPKGQTWQFQPSIFIASGSLSVTATGLPAGITINSGTGLITCDGETLPGVYALTVRASDGSLTTDPKVFTVGIRAASDLLAGSSDVGIDLYVDKVTREVTLPGAAAAAGAGAVPVAVEEDLPLITIKENDTVLFNIRYFAGLVQLDPDPDELKIAIKDLESKEILVESTEFVVGDTGASAFFKVPLTLTGDKLSNALADAETADESAVVNAKVEIQIVKTVSIGAVPKLRITSKTFRVFIERDIASNS
jgi:hypothetical protein